MAKEEKSKEKVSLIGYDPVESPEEIINADKDTNRKEAFKEAYKKIATIIPEYFMTMRKRRKGTGAGGTSFSQNIVVTPDKVTLQTKEVSKNEEKVEEKERGE